jgi:hypothetical protein
VCSVYVCALWGSALRYRTWLWARASMHEVDGVVHDVMASDTDTDGCAMSWMWLMAFHSRRARGLRHAAYR